MVARSLRQSLQSAKKLNVFLIFPLHCLSLVSAILSPLPANGTNTTLPSLLLPANVSTLAAPLPPPGFGVLIHYDTSETLSPLGMYLSSIDCMYQFAQIGWYKGLTGGFTVWVAGFDVELDIVNSQEPHGVLEFRTSHIILGLYKTVTEVSAHSRFCKVLATLSLHSRQIGTLVIQKRAPESMEKDEANATTSIMVKGSPNSTALTYPSGRVTDSDDHDFSMFYTYSDARINSKDVFLAVLDALAIAAQFSPSRPFRSLDAISPSGNCVISFLEVDSPFQVNYSFVTKALRTMVVDIMVYLRKFGEMTLRLDFQLVSMAEGSIKLAEHRTTAQ